MDNAVSVLITQCIKGELVVKIMHLPTRCVPNSLFAIISVPQLDDADCYVLFGAGRCVAFESTDDGKMVEDLLMRSTKIVLTATQRPDQLYYLDVL